MKRTLSVMLVLTMLCGCFAFPAFAADTASADLKSSLVVAYDFEGNTTDFQLMDKATAENNAADNLKVSKGTVTIENGVATAVRRDTHEKVQLNLENIKEEVSKLLDEIQENMFNQALENFNNSIIETDNYEEMVNAVNDKKVALCYHCGDSNCEEEIRQNTTIKTRVIHSYDENQKCIYCGKPSKYRVYFGKQY